MLAPYCGMAVSRRDGFWRMERPPADWPMDVTLWELLVHAYAADVEVWAAAGSPFVGSRVEVDYRRMWR